MTQSHAHKEDEALQVPVAFHDPTDERRQEAFVFASDYPDGTPTHTMALYARPPSPVVALQVVTDAEVEAACKAACFHVTPESRKDMRRALESFAASRPVAVGVSAKHSSEPDWTGSVNGWEPIQGTPPDGGQRACSEAFVYTYCGPIPGGTWKRYALPSSVHHELSTTKAGGAS